MSLVLCVTLWPIPDRERELAAYEDVVLALLPEHGGRLVARVRASESGDAGRADASRDSGVTSDAGAGSEAGVQSDAGAGHPFETQLIEFADDAGVDAYMADPRRTARTAERDVAIARTEIQRVTLV